MPASLCPLTTNPSPLPPEPLTPHNPTGLAYSFTVPGEPRSAGIARNAVRSALRAHGLDGMDDPALQVVSELVACAIQFAPGEDLYHSLRWRDGTLRLVNWDPHSTHCDPLLTATCMSLRRRQLLLLACVVREHGGTWGIAQAAPATEGTKVWVNLPGDPATSY
ncbi:ATP-binding protein [Streptomyces sp. ISL-11]|uniref:ATP-binding protein n=1 Tax=Streptomyces sp. ISL-11 TaxID=2819174 RepID=UPI001BE5EC4E|nr:ATP-binding protein [Streptomyces sp. ISL-11]MBT2383615.1 ATP-binding protein [Streptomyces sp. ISL-11]